jgi:dephospho-CoA kinase
MAGSFTVIGITGTIGAGKGTVVDKLVEPPHNFVHYSARTLLNGMIAEQGLPPGRDSMRDVANALRKARGPAAVIEALFAQARAVGKDAIIESVRTEGEIIALRKTGLPFTLLAIDADQRTRYQRITSRGSSTDTVSFDEFCAQEAKEMSSAEAHEQNLSRCMSLADVTLLNNGTQAQFAQRIDAFASSLRLQPQPRRPSRSLATFALVGGVILLAAGAWWSSSRRREEKQSSAAEQ